MSHHSPIQFRNSSEKSGTSNNTRSSPSTKAQHDSDIDHESHEDFPPLTGSTNKPNISDKDLKNETTTADTDDAVPLREDVGPRTLHRKPKPKHAIPFKVLKARAAAEAVYGEDEEGDPLAQIAILPPELLARIFAYLDARSIVQCAFVCRAFNYVVRDEATWRLAFSLAFRIEAVETDQVTTPILRRVDLSSWKQEYAQRTDLIRRWRKARAPTVICDARVGSIHSIALSLPHNFLLSASLEHGVASRCDPFTGKISKGFLDASGQVHAVGLAALAAEQGVLDISSLRLDSDATRIAWGFHTGAVAMTNLARQGTNPRGLVRGIQFSMRSSHVGPVLDIAMPFGTGLGGSHSIERSPEKIRQKQALLGDASESFVTAGMDGTVRLWNPKKAVPLWSGVVRSAKQGSRIAPVPIPVARIAFHLESGTIVGATVNGDLTLWTNIDIDGLLSLPASAFEEPTTIEPTLAQRNGRKAMQDVHDRIISYTLPAIRLTGKDSSLILNTLMLDIELTGTTHDRNYEVAHLLYCCEKSNSFERLTINLKDQNDLIVSNSFIVPGNGEIICLRPDFDTKDHATRASSSMTGIISKPGQNASPIVDQYTGQALFSERKFVCAGTQDGKLVIWDWEQGSQDGETIQAWSCLDAHHMPITAIDVTDHAIVIGSSDGVIKAFCPLSGQLIRTFNDRAATRHPARMLAAGQLTAEEASRFHVGQIIAGPETIVACIGSQVLAWRAERLRNNKMNAGKKAVSRTGRNNMGKLWDPKMQSMKEMERDVYETKQELQQEHERRVADSQRLGVRIESDFDDMTEQEAFEYAMMLSRDEMDEKSRREGESGLNRDPRYIGSNDLQEVLEQIAGEKTSIDSNGMMARLDTDDEEEEEEEERSGLDDSQDDANRRYIRSKLQSSTTSPASSPHMSAFSSPPSRAWDIIHKAGPSASRNTRVGDAHSKVQAVHVPRTARISSQSTATSSRRESNSSLPMPMLNSPQEWPMFEPSTSMSGRSPSRLELGSPVPTSLQTRNSGVGNRSNSFNVPISSTQSPSSSFHTRSPIGAWAQGSPSLRPVNYANPTSGSPSALSASRPSQRNNLTSEQTQNQTQNAMSDDDDLRFAIELSLAEERSRQELNSHKTTTR